MLTAHIQLTLLITGLATAGAVVFFLAPATMMNTSSDNRLRMG
jgi:hypothetical protein